MLRSAEVLNACNSRRLLVRSSVAEQQLRNVGFRCNNSASRLQTRLPSKPMVREHATATVYQHRLLSRLALITIHVVTYAVSSKDVPMKGRFLLVQ